MSIGPEFVEEEGRQPLEDETKVEPEEQEEQDEPPW